MNGNITFAAAALIEIKKPFILGCSRSKHGASRASNFHPINTRKVFW